LDRADTIATYGSQQIECAARCRVESVLQAPANGVAVGQQVVEVRLDGHTLVRVGVERQRQ
jgi:hypothetical protein